MGFVYGWTQSLKLADCCVLVGRHLADIVVEMGDFARRY